MKAIKICMVMLVFLVFIQAGHSQNIEFVGSYDDLLGVYDVSVEWPYAYVCQYVAYPCFMVLDISNPEQPELVGSWDGASTFHDMEIVGDNVFLANDAAGIFVLNISDPTNPFPVGSYQLPEYAYKIWIEEDLAYVANGMAGLSILDISNPAYPIPVCTYDTPGSVGGIFIRDQVAYIPDHWDIMHTLDISDPGEPQFMATVRGEGWARKGITVFNDYAYVATWENSLYIINVEEPEYPYPVRIYNTPGNCLDVYINNYLYISDFEAGIQILDISNPSEPTLVAEYDTPGEARCVTVAENYIFVADVTSLQILRLMQTDIVDRGENLPRGISILNNYPNPFNSSTVISYEISLPGFVNLSIYNIVGQKVACLVNQNREAGVYSVSWNADGLSTGIYLARIDTGDSSNTIKMHLLK